MKWFFIKKKKLIGINFRHVEFVLKVFSGAQSPHFMRIWSKSLYSYGTECPEEGGLLGKGTSIIYKQVKTLLVSGNTDTAVGKSK